MNMIVFNESHIESRNFNARGFWLKYFTEYTHSVVRRIEEKAVNINLL